MSNTQRYFLLIFGVLLSMFSGIAADFCHNAFSLLILQLPVFAGVVYLLRVTALAFFNLAFPAAAVLGIFLWLRGNGADRLTALKPFLIVILAVVPVLFIVNTLGGPYINVEFLRRFSMADQGNMFSAMNLIYLFTVLSRIVFLGIMALGLLGKTKSPAKKRSASL